MLATILISIGTGLLTATIVLIIVLPKKVQYIETINVNATVEKVYDAIRYQERLMNWSAWPSETNSLCAVKNVDGQIGAQTVFLNRKGKQFGYQEITHLVPNEKVSFFLKSDVVPFEEDVRLHFILKPLHGQHTQVNLWFDETLKKPQFLIAYIGGITKWVHKMHLKDLAGLKKFVESDSQ
ncbi:SRPBCC domain-containing protein [Flagellimonas meridianipacifica]|uniref:Activator of Hsp90 ATPase-like protein n=1 Tax=Flagellimonas meridianipacifica TaxID=1080225 RepID=A0A2T0MFC5_9FLAO|nr:SRPBCC domain-containing protein [Allomuricauda pacifica]PRX56279.1 activator of Hsp90 ATPase-like protein [Allomuricauda pacifica]